VKRTQEVQEESEVQWHDNKAVLAVKIYCHADQRYDSRCAISLRESTVMLVISLAVSWYKVFSSSSIFFVCCL
jgi:hypothetical protein